MPSIMDLVREYSELEIKRNERGGMLEPQAEIRYQALKFFLEFELFQIPEQKSTYQSVSYEKARTHSSLAEKKTPESTKIKREPEPLVSAVSSQSTQDTQENTIHREDLASITSETSLPISEAPQPTVSPTDILPTDMSEEIKTENVVESISPSEVVLQPEKTENEPIEMAEVVEEPDANTNPIQSTPLEPAVSPNLLDTEGLSSHIDTAFENVIQEEPAPNAEDIAAENVSILENSLSDMPLIQPEETAPSISLDTNLGVPNISPPSTSQEIDANINIADILKQVETAATVEPSQTTDAISLNIEEIVPQTNVVETLKPEAGSIETKNPLNIDFLSGIINQTEGSTSTAPQEDTTTPSPAIEEILPTEFLSPIDTPENESVKTYVDSTTKVAVHLIDGDARRGIIRVLNSSQSEIELFLDEQMEESIRLPIKDVKAVFLMKQQEEQVEEVYGSRIRVKFKDDRIVEGITTDYAENAPIFTLSPAIGGQSVKKIIVYKNFVDSVEFI